MYNVDMESLPQFRTAEEELNYLRARITEQESILRATQIHESAQSAALEQGKEQIANQIVDAYRVQDPEKVLHHESQMSHQEIGAISLNLAPEAHDSQIEGLYALMLQKGVLNTLKVVENIRNPHLSDDFHRFLVQYLVAAQSLPKLPKKNEFYQQLEMTLYEVTLPEPEDGKQGRGFKEMVATMEQMLYGLQSIGQFEKTAHHWYSLELAVPAESTHVSFYVSVPNIARDLFEKQLFALYTNAKAEVVPNDYNVFSEDGIVLGAYAVPSYSEMTAIKTYDQFEADPIDVLVQVFSKLAEAGEGALLQVVVQPHDDGTTKEYIKNLERLKKGDSFKDINKKFSGWDTFTSIFGSAEKKDEEKSPAYNYDNEVAGTQLQKKLQSPIVATCIRLVVSSASLDRGTQIMQEIKSGFQQFYIERGGGIIFKDIKPNDMSAFTHDISYRVSNPRQVYHLSLGELATLFHFPATAEKAAHLKRKQSSTAPAPYEVPKEGLLLGYNEHRGVTTPIHMVAEDRMRHFYVIGQTGTGKTGGLVSMIAQDIANGEGVCFIDPHGNDVQTIMSMIPEHRIQDVIYFDPTYLPRPMGLNMLEFDPRFPQQKSLIVDQLMMIFNQLFDMKMAGGPMFEQYFKNATYLVMEHPESGCTLMEIARVMQDKSYRDMKLSHCNNPLIIQFWEAATKTKGDQGLENMVPWITSKFDPFLSNEFMRPIVAQEHSAFNIRDLMDNKKILLLNLSKGLLGELNAKLLGMLIVGKMQMAAMSRADSYGQKLSDFFLYIDEFQNFLTPAISSILSEARKYRLSLNIAHQNMAQLTDPVIKGAIFGNVGTKCVFRVDASDAAELEIYMKPFMKEDIIKLENRNCYTAMLANGLPLTAFNMKTPDWGEMNKNMIDVIKQYTYMTYCRDRAEVEAEILSKYKKPEEPKPPEMAPPMPGGAVPTMSAGGLADLF